MTIYTLVSELSDDFFGFFLMICIFFFFLTTNTYLFLCLSYPFDVWSSKSASILYFEGGFWYNIESSWYFWELKVKIKSSFQKNQEKLKLNYLTIEKRQFLCNTYFWQNRFCLFVLSKINYRKYLKCSPNIYNRINGMM